MKGKSWVKASHLKRFLLLKLTDLQEAASTAVKNVVPRRDRANRTSEQAAIEAMEEQRHGAGGTRGF
jgi:hypothetical protein